MEGLQKVRIFLTQGDLDVYRREHDEEAKVKVTYNSASVNTTKDNIVWTLISKFGKTQALLISVCALTTFLYYLTSYAVQKVTPASEESDSSGATEYFY